MELVLFKIVHLWSDGFGFRDKTLVCFTKNRPAFQLQGAVSSVSLN